MNTWTNCLHENYSMIEDTVPDPTAHPPSRYLTGVLRCANGDFSCDCGEKSGFSIVSVWFFGILLSWCYHSWFIPAFSINIANDNSKIFTFSSVDMISDKGIVLSNEIPCATS